MIIDSRKLQIQNDNNHLIEDLEALGGTSDEVAKTLMSLGIKGKYGLARQCPIARYLLSKGRSNITVGMHHATMKTPWYFVTTPAAVQVFIRRFDDHEFPEMIEA